jgi:DNA-directed RNA polymerase specialized sigma subunit
MTAKEIKDRNECIVEAYKRLHKTPLELSKIYHCKEDTVRKVLLDSGIKLICMKNDKRDREIKDMYWSGKYTQEQVAEKFGLSLSRVHMIIKEKKQKRVRK